MSTTHPVITIDLVLDRHTGKDVLRAVLHSVLFHRLFGTVKPKTFEVLDVTMPAVDNEETEQLVDQKVDAFWKGIEGGVNKRGQINVIFSEKRAKKSWFLLERGPWEQWTINAEVRQPTTERDRQKFNTDLAAALTKSLRSMLTHTSSEPGRAAVPLITVAQGISPFPYKIIVKVNGIEMS